MHAATRTARTVAAMSVTSSTSRSTTPTGAEPPLTPGRFRWQRDRAALEVGLEIFEPGADATASADQHRHGRVAAAALMVPLAVAAGGVAGAGMLGWVAAVAWYLHP